MNHIKHGSLHKYWNLLNRSKGSISNFHFTNKNQKHTQYKYKNFSILNSKKAYKFYKQEAQLCYLNNKYCQHRWMVMTCLLVMFIFLCIMPKWDQCKQYNIECTNYQFLFTSKTIIKQSQTMQKLSFTDAAVEPHLSQTEKLLVVCTSVLSISYQHFQLYLHNQYILLSMKILLLYIKNFLKNYHLKPMQISIQIYNVDLK
ncbi:unnamed protein product [Paramecium octaurelia]|uniref:Transmembrane protein n=1 Tax=Paramecium octaurelia TaxID=43137 RepID=A0A8S1TQS5_PAROT|nr:unnamed protein product [Paramecium octaurelia]